MRRDGEPARERLGSIEIRRLPMTHRRGGIARYVWEYLWFPLMAGLYLAWLDRRRRFDLVQVNTVPDWLVFAALGPKLRGTPVLLDLHECMPEFFASKFGASLSHPAARLIALLEQASIRFATYSITCTEQMREAFVARGASADQIAVVMNSTDEATFDPARQHRQTSRNGHFSLVAHGTLEERYGIDTIIRAVGRLRTQIPGLRLEIYGEGSYMEELRGLADGLELDGRVNFHGFVPIEQLVAGIAEADAGVVAMKRDVFRDLTHCNKMFDLITMRKPVLCSRTSSVMAYFPNGALKYFDAGDDGDLARAIAELYDHPEQCDQLVHHATATNEPYRWPHQRRRYTGVIEELVAT